MTEVPDGQVPRDAAFWRTYYAVAAQDAAAALRASCARDGHALVLGASADEPCQVCGTPRDEAMRELGFVSDGDRWVARAPAGAPGR